MSAAGEQVAPAFISQMEREIRANAHKNAPGTFRDWVPTPEELVLEIELHTAKLVAAIRAGNRAKVAEHAGDCGLNAMKAHQLWG